MSTVTVRLEFIGYNDEDDTTTKTDHGTRSSQSDGWSSCYRYPIRLSRTIPAPLRPVIDPDAFNEFCLRVEKAFVPLHTIQKSFRLPQWYDVLLGIVLTRWIMTKYCNCTGVTEMIRLANLIVFLLWFGILLFSKLFNNLSYTIPKIEQICSDMTHRYNNNNNTGYDGTSFHLKTITYGISEDKYETYIECIEVRIWINPDHIMYIRTLVQTNLYATSIPCVRDSADDPYHMERTLPSQIEHRLRMDMHAITPDEDDDPTIRTATTSFDTFCTKYTLFCDKMDHLLQLLHVSSKHQKPQNDYLCLLGYSILSVLTFTLPKIYSWLGIALIGEVLFLRCWGIYRVYRFERRQYRQIGSRRSINNIYHEIYLLLHDEMSTLSPNISFHLRRPCRVSTKVKLFSNVTCSCNRSTESPSRNSQQPQLYAYIVPMIHETTEI